MHCGIVVSHCPIAFDIHDGTHDSRIRHDSASGITALDLKRLDEFQPPLYTQCEWYEAISHALRPPQTINSCIRVSDHLQNVNA